VIAYASLRRTFDAIFLIEIAHDRWLVGICGSKTSPNQTVSGYDSRDRKGLSHTADSGLSESLKLLLPEKGKF
jgi:hypothetical protein